jgi:hypothetical protein
MATATIQRGMTKIQPQSWKPRKSYALAPQRTATTSTYDARRMRPVDVRSPQLSPHMLGLGGVRRRRRGRLGAWTVIGDAAATTREQALATIADESSIDPFWGQLAATLIQTGGSVASNVLVAKEKYKAAGGTEEGFLRAQMLAQRASGGGGSGTLIALGAVGLIAVLLLSKKG